MKRFPLFAILALAASAMFAGIGSGHAQDAIDKAQAEAFDSRMFGGPVGQKSYACFVRRYDSAHLAHHPKQKVSAMKLLVSAEVAPEEQVTNYSFQIGFKYRHRSGNFNSVGSCHHAVAEDAGNEIHFSCGVECDGGGVELALSKDDKSAVVELDRIATWKRGEPDAKRGTLAAGADDKKFRLERANLRECADLLPDRKEVAALPEK